MGKSASAKQRVVEYRMSFHYGIATQVDGIKEIQFGEKIAWSGSVTDQTAIKIQYPNLFGGIKEEGGVCGLAVFLPGDRQQTIPDGLASRMGLTRDTCPGYRGLSSIFFVGNPGLTIDGAATNSTSNVSEFNGLFSGSTVSQSNLARFWDLYKTIISAGPRGFYLSANNPYLKSIWVRAWRAAKGLDPAKAMIGQDTNPGHMLFEILTDRTNGMGASTGIIDVAEFEAFASKLFDEAFGLSMLWTKQTTIQAFAGEILDHVQGVIYVNPRTGLLTPKLLRDDYDVNALREINPSNATLTGFQRKTWGETINEIVVSYTDSTNETNPTTAAQDLGNIAMQGGEVISDSRNYYGVQNPELAAFLAERDLATAATPLASCTAKMDRTVWDIVPGEVFVLTWPEYNIERIVVRANVTDYGTVGNPYITVSLLEDVFSATIASYTIPPDSGHEDTGEAPADINYTRMFTEPAYLVAGRLSDSDLAAQTYPSVNAVVLGAQESADTRGYDLYTYEADNLGNLSYQFVSSRSLVTRAKLSTYLPAEASSTMETFNNIIGNTPTIGWYGVIGPDNQDETTWEMVLVSDVVDTGYVMVRGILDTVPREWAENTPIWFVRPDIEITDPTVRSDSTEAEYKFLTKTSLGTLPLTTATVHSVDLLGRPYYPLRPANVKVNAVGFGVVDAESADTVIPVTWANRNRLTETAQILTWTDGSVTPEVGQTTTITITDSDGVTITSYEGLTGTSYDVPVADLGGTRNVWFTLSSTRDDFDSLQSFTLRVIAPSTEPVTGDVAMVGGKAAQAIAGSTTVVGTVATVAGKAAQAIAGSTAINGTVATVAGGVSQSISGTTTVIGTVAAIGGKASQSISGTTTVIGQAATVAGPASQSIFGGGIVTGTVETVAAGASMSAAGGPTINGTAATVAAGASQSISGTVEDLPTVYGTAGTIAGGASQAIAGTTTVLGTAANTAGSASQAIAGTTTVLGTAANTAGSASQAISGSVGATFDPPTWIANTPLASGTGAITPTFASTGRVAGDFLVLQVESANQAITKPTGFELLSTQSLGTAGAAGAVRQTVFGKFSDGTETTVSIADSGDHTTAVGSVYRGVDPTTVQNLLYNSNDLTNTTYWHPFGGVGAVGSGNLITINGSTGQTEQGVYTDSFANLTVGQKYTLLFNVQTNSGTAVMSANIYCNGDNSDNIAPDITATTTKTRYRHQITIPAGTTYTNLGFCAGAALANTAFKVTEVQLVKGDVDTSYPYLATTSAAALTFVGINASAGKTQAATTSIVFDGLTTTKDNCLVVNMMANDRDAASTSNLSSVTNASLTDLNKRFDETVTAGQGGGLALITGVRAAAGSVSGTTATNAASVANASFTMALAPSEVVIPADGWHPTALEASLMTLSNGNKTAVGNNSGGTGNNRIRSVAGKSTGKWFASISIDAHEYGDVSVTDSADLNYVHFNYDGDIYSSVGSTLTNIGGYSAPCVIDLAFDADAHLVWFRVNGGNWNGNASYDPAAGTGGFALPSSGLPYHVKAQMPYFPASQRTLNTGSSTFTYSPPSGFTALQT